MNDPRTTPLMLPFPRISPDHVLTHAARAVNSYTDEHGIPTTLAWIGLDVDQGELAYLAQQRALRVCSVAWFGHNMGADAILDEVFAVRVAEDPRWADVRSLLIGAYMDGIVIGWQARAESTNTKGAT